MGKKTKLAIKTPKDVHTEGLKRVSPREKKADSEKGQKKGNPKDKGPGNEEAGEKKVRFEEDKEKAETGEEKEKKVTKSELDAIVERLAKVPDDKCGKHTRHSRRDTAEDGNDGRAQLKAVTEEEAAQIGERLYNATTKSSHPEEPKSGDEKVGVPKEKADEITQRLYNGHTVASSGSAGDARQSEDTISKRKYSDKEIDEMVDRLNSTMTESLKQEGIGGTAAHPRHAHLTEDEVVAIFDRLRTTHTKSSVGALDCKQAPDVPVPGLGQKMYPIIEGLDKRFQGRSLTEEQANEIMQRLRAAQTTSSQARLDNPRILLYPERTKLCNNIDRIKEFQCNGAVAKQKTLERCEKWYF